MGEEVEDEGVAPSATGEPAAIAAALGSATPEARDYLRRQARLTNLQIDQLEKSERFEVSHLHFRRLTDLGKLALQIATGLVVLLAVTGLGTMVWSAAHARGMTVEAFSVPPDVAQTGLTGGVFANRLIDRFGRLQVSSLAISQGTSSTRRESADTVRVEIPETGVSIGELDRYLREWLGHESHVGGDLIHDAKGYSLTVRYGDNPGVTVSGSDLDALLTQGAEQLMAAAVPYRYVEYLGRKHRVTEALAVLPALAAAGDAHDKARAYSAWASMYFRQSDYAAATEKAYAGLKLEPHNPILWAWAGTAEGNLMHQEAFYRAMLNVPDRLPDALAAEMAPDVAGMLPTLMRTYRQELKGDLAAALANWDTISRVSFGGAYDPGSHANDAIQNHDWVLAWRLYSGIPAADLTNPGTGLTNSLLAGMQLHAARDDWAGAARLGQEADANIKGKPGRSADRLNYLPLLAIAMAQGGDQAGSEALIQATPPDCDACLEAQGKIAALKKDWAAAARDFAALAARTPSLPLADTDWGAMLLQKGDVTGAIAKFQSANAKGPHFADPLELWGEALMAQNRSDLALAKFAEAGKYAPQWGRLHLKWAEALVYAGKRDEAHHQFEMAQGLGMAPSERGELGYQRRITGL